MRRLRTALLLWLSVLPLACRPTGGNEAPREAQPHPVDLPLTESIRLVLWITVDQLRGDFLERFSPHLDAGGFERLLDEGAYFPRAHFTHAITETAPGHATLFTGAPPARHGIVGNGWLNRDTGHEMASVADEAAPLIGAELPAEQAADAGRSPRQLLVPTIGDAMTQATAGRAKVFSISVKDRAAILPGGFSGKAFWLGPAGFVSSRYYYDALPDWVTTHNLRFPVSAHRGTWTLLHPQERYQRRALDDRPAERPIYGLGRTFPHPISGEGPALAQAVAATPFGDELTVSFALEALGAEELGADDVPDLLAVSLSSTDLVGHAFGPESLEAEDNFVRLDRQLARLLNGVDRIVGLNRTLVVLSADHGVCETAEHLDALGLAGRRIEPEDLLQTARAAAARHFGEAELVLGFANPTLWVNRALAERRRIDVESIAGVVARALEERGDVYRALPTAPLLAARTSGQGPTHPDDPLGPVERSLHRLRSGDVYVVPRPYALLLQHPEIAATHGSPWQYDTHVPVLLRGPGVLPGVHPRPIAPSELAGSVALVLGMTAPAGAGPATLTELTPKPPGR